MKKNANKLVCVVICYNDGIKQMNCFSSNSFADGFISFTKKFHASNIKKIYRLYFDAIYPIINYSKDYL